MNLISLTEKLSKIKDSINKAAASIDGVNLRLSEINPIMGSLFDNLSTAVNSFVLGSITINNNTQTSVVRTNLVKSKELLDKLDSEMKKTDDIINKLVNMPRVLIPDFNELNYEIYQFKPTPSYKVHQFKPIKSIDDKPTLPLINYRPKVDLPIKAKSNLQSLLKNGNVPGVDFFKIKYRGKGRPSIWSE